ncbi:MULTISPECIES: bifunctional DedA family/phosphatase PAP2 family protein [unclassified Halomonas]|uniref:bifunctional DedA family/phosphatase PAP2 family protein n=1 Tax=unclassified Halomonas TaxID=2609666 RepID=UPI00246834C7|nr:MULTISPECIES: bifunctional DedA family/phosphatase PAP2 family protein [unclassified Halomonas]
MIDTLVADLTAASAQHWLLAYLLVGLFAMAESIPVVGIIVPGSVLIVGIGALVPSGALGVWPLIIAAIAGAVIGDGLSFWLGRRYEQRLIAMWPLRRYPRLVTQAEGFFTRHGGKGVFLARFVQGPRAFVPLVAGMSGMSPTRFYAFNIVSALVWATSHVIAGVALGASLHLIAQIAGRLTLFLVLLALLIWIVVWLTRHILLGSGLRGLVLLQNRVVLWSAEGDTRTKRLVRGLLQPERSETRALLVGAAILAGSLWLFLGILEDIVTGDPLVQANQAVFHFLQGLRTTWGDHLMLAITELGDSVIVVILTGVMLGWLLWCRAWQAAGYWIAAIGGAALFTPLIKWAVHWPRPTALYSGWEAFSFPSGHATLNAVLYGFLGFLIARELSPRRRVWVISSVSVPVMLIAFSRLYLGAHWLADVIAGIAVATAWVTLLAIGYTRHRPRSLDPRGLVGVALLTLAIAWPWHVLGRFADDQARYLPSPEQQQLSLGDWRDHAYRQLPDRRIDLGGESEEPMTLQWAGELAALERELGRHGWQPRIPWNLSSTVQWLGAGTTTAGLPVLPRLHDGRAPALQLTHAIDGSPSMRMVLQVWATNVKLTRDETATGMPLWIGSVVTRRRYQLLGLVPLDRALPTTNAARDRLAESLGERVMIERPMHSPGEWDGRLILAWETSG